MVNIKYPHEQAQKKTLDRYPKGCVTKNF